MFSFFWAQERSTWPLKLRSSEVDVGPPSLQPHFCKLRRCNVDKNPLLYSVVRLYPAGRHIYPLCNALCSVRVVSEHRDALTHRRKPRLLVHGGENKVRVRNVHRRLGRGSRSRRVA